MVTATQAEEGRMKPEMPFQQAPNDLLMACMTRGSVTQRACLAAMLAANYGATKQLADINRKAISRATGATPQAVRIALCRLVKENVVIRTEDGYRVNPRYWQWEGADPEQAKEYRRLGRPRKAFPARNKAFPPRNDAPQEAFPHGNGAFLPGNEAFPPRNETFPPRNAPLKREEIYTQKTLSQSACEPPANTSRSFPDPPPEPEPMPASTLHPKATPERRQAVIALADQAGGWGYEAGKELQLGADPDHLEEAIRRGVRGKARSWQYVARIADGFRVHGIDPPPPPPHAPDRPQRHRPGSPEALAEWKARRDAAWGITPEREAVA